MNLKGSFKEKIGNSPKTTVATIVLVANAFVWYLYSGRFLNSITSSGEFSGNQVNIVWGVYIFGTAVAALCGVFLITRVKKRVVFLRYWMLAGIFLSLLPLIVNIRDFNALTIFFGLVGVYFGIGMPAALGYYAASTVPLNRAKMGGITFLTIFAGVLFLGIIGASGEAANAVVLASCQAISLAVIAVLKPAEKEILQSERVSYRTVFKNKMFLLYFVPWMMFSIVNYVTIPIVSGIFPDLFSQSMMIENVLSGVFAVIFGFLGDRVGRKRLVVAGFVLIGLGYASLGLFLENVYGWWFFTAVDGIAWGAFYAIFFMAMWGDVAQGKSSEKYYAVGYLPFLFSILAQMSMGANIAMDINRTAIFSFASVFLFVAVLPLAYAPETLPEKIVKERELKNYLAKAQRIKMRDDSKTK
jgi:hypothetical protein